MWPFMYDLNQIPYDFTEEVRNRFKELDLIDRVPDELWTLHRRQGSRPSPIKRNAKKQNGCLRSLTHSCEKKRSEKQRKQRKIYPYECMGSQSQTRLSD